MDQKTASLTPLQHAASQRKLFEAKIIARAWEDEAFRKQLDSDPVAALKAAGVPLPDGLKVVVEHEPAETLLIVIPAKPDFASKKAGAQELDDGALAGIAGGTASQSIMSPVYDAFNWFFQSFEYHEY